MLVEWPVFIPNTLPGGLAPAVNSKDSAIDASVSKPAWHLIALSVPRQCDMQHKTMITITGHLVI